MSNRFVRTVLAALIAVGVIFCIEVLPKLWVKHTAQQVAKDVAKDVAQKNVQSTIQDIAREQARTIATQEAAKILAHDSAATMSVVDRPTFTIAIPAGATVDPEPADAKASITDKDHLTVINLPGGATVFVTAIDKQFTIVDDAERIRKATENYFDSTVKAWKTRLAGVTGSDSAYFANSKATRSTVLNGTLKGVSTVMDVAQFDGAKSGCVLLVTYPESDKAATANVVRRVLATFVMK